MVVPQTERAEIMIKHGNMCAAIVSARSILDSVLRNVVKYEIRDDMNQQLKLNSFPHQGRIINIIYNQTQDLP